MGETIGSVIQKIDEMNDRGSVQSGFMNSDSEVIYFSEYRKLNKLIILL